MLAEFYISIPITKNNLVSPQTAAFSSQRELYSSRRPDRLRKDRVPDLEDQFTRPIL